MKRHLTSLLLVLALCLGLAMPASAAEGEKITVGDQTYEALLQAIMSETKADSVTARLDSDVTLTAAIVIGSSDYNGLFSEPMTVTAKNVTVDLNGHTLTAAKDCAAFEVQKDYTLTIVDNSEAKTGKLVCGVEEAVVVAEGGTYNALPAAEDEAPAEEPAETVEVPEGELALGFYMVAAYAGGHSGSTNATADANGLAQANVDIYAVTIDSNGVIVDCKIDAIQCKTNFDATGASSPRSAR